MMALDRAGYSVGAGGQPDYYEICGAIFGLAATPLAMRQVGQPDIPAEI